VALPAYLTLTGTSQGKILGSVTQRGREGSILVIGFMHQIVAPRDPASGIPTGKRAHKPFSILKPVDASSPKLYHALCHNENLPSWELKLFRPKSDGTEFNNFTVTLRDATVCGISSRMPNNRDPKRARLEMYEEVEFTYRHIEWTSLEGKTSASDDWNAPVT
jgi:type VI secretion system secreted protein Hcp